ncbi:MAG: FHA domain-containing protein [Actinophytocola sp.]|uniref:FHA domain-containing protein n=1 Tax=Actinophytocola sp. TaxID=1872138 RepID=UPI003C76A491
MEGSTLIADGRRLSSSHDSLAFGVPRSAPGAIYALAISGGFAVGPSDGRTVVFGRNKPEVHVCIGEDDRRVSRRHGLLTCQDGRWWVSNTGRLPIRLPDSQWLFSDEESLPLAAGYTPLFVPGTRGREHLLELYVAGADGARPAPRPGDVTEPPRTWRLRADERLVLIALGQRYLRHESDPQPMGRQQVADQLNDLRPGTWTARKVEHTVTAVRARLSKSGVPGLTREEVGEPVGNKLNDNLLRELLLSTTLVPPDLRVIETAGDDAGEQER